MTPEAAKSLLLSSQCVADIEEIDHALSDMANKINLRFAESNPVILAVMTGAMVFAGQLLPRLSFPMEIDYLQVNRYGKNLTGGTICWRIEPQINLHGRSVLIIDDVLDEGITLDAACKKAFSLGASEVLTAVFINKQINTAKAIQADFIGIELPDRFLFGFGLDASGYWRNLPCIYAMASNQNKDP